MIPLVLALVPVSLGISLPLTALMVRLGHRLGALDSPGVPGQIKTRRPVPNTGGVAIFWAIALPMLAALAAAWWADPAIVDRLRPGAAAHLPGARAQTPLALLLLGALLLLHVL